jgi:lysophospholipase L1-like esterase
VSPTIEDKTLCAYGHSWALGTGASRPEQGFCALMACLLGLRCDNRAESGSLSTETARRVAVNPPPEASLFVLMIGLNDARRYGRTRAARAAYAEALSQVLGAFFRASTAAAVLALEQPYIRDYSGYDPFHRASDTVVDAYNATLRQAVSPHPSAGVVAIEGWAVDAMIGPDGVHPNDAGHRHLARAAVRAWDLSSPAG